MKPKKIKVYLTEEQISHLHHALDILMDDYGGEDEVVKASESVKDALAHAVELTMTLIERREERKLRKEARRKEIRDKLMEKLMQDAKSSIGRTLRRMQADKKQRD